MAAYAALVSVMQTVDEITNHPRPPISLHENQVDSLTEKVDFLQNFLEAYSKEEDELESRIADAAYAVEDVIESHIVDQIHGGSTSHGENISCVDFYEGLERVIEDMDLIKKEVMDIAREKKMGAQHHQQMNSANSWGSIGPVRPVSRVQNNTMVDFGDILIDIMYKLTRQEHNLEIVPIVGMGGIGKTTLAKSIYAHSLIVQHFDILAWVTISQEYSVREILSQLLSEENDEGETSKDHELGERVYKKLWGRRYLIVMDDIWSIQAWDKVKAFFPKNNNGSRIVMTTRLSNLAFVLSGSHDFKMKFLNDVKSWDLLCETVFDKEGCPIELENIGKEIARNCRGLPLSIVVIGGLLAKSDMTRDYWEYTLQNMSSLINLENKEHCLQILRSSYKELPIHLKPCFLYMGVFPEDHVIHLPTLVKLWVAEGILKPIENKSLEQVGKHYIKELVDRNLIIVHKLNWNMKATSCKIHDLLRDLCLREAKRQRFFCVLRTQDLNIPEDINMERRICIHHNIIWKFPPRFVDAVDSVSLIRSLLLFDNLRSISPSFTSRLLRVYLRTGYYDSSDRGYGDAEALLERANMRHLYIKKFDEQCSFLWNLRTLYGINPWKSSVAPARSDIWKMPQLRHVLVKRFELVDPPRGEDDVVLENLQTMSSVLNFKCGEEVVKRIRNVRKLKLYYDRDRVEVEGLGSFCLNNLCRLQSLTSLYISIAYRRLSSSYPFDLGLPHSLKKLYLHGTKFLWDDITTKIGSLPHLEVLKLDGDSCIGPKWETFEGKFCSLKFLRIGWCDLKSWITDGTHFPRLEHLVLESLNNLEEIPLSIGDIPTLQSIKMEYCLESVNISGERIREEQLSYGNEDLQVLIEGLFP